MTVVLDTNIVASATYWRGKPAHCLEAWVLGKFDVAISHAILREYEEVILRLATRYPQKKPTRWLDAIKQSGHLYLPGASVLATSDADDQMFIDCAVAARARYLVSGDKDHRLKLKKVVETEIVNVSDFLKVLGMPENPA